MVAGPRSGSETFPFPGCSPFQYLFYDTVSLTHTNHHSDTFSFSQVFSSFWTRFSLLWTIQFNYRTLSAHVVGHIVGYLRILLFRRQMASFGTAPFSSAWLFFVSSSFITWSSSLFQWGLYLTHPEHDTKIGARNSGIAPTATRLGVRLRPAASLTTHYCTLAYDIYSYREFTLLYSSTPTVGVPKW